MDQAVRAADRRGSALNGTRYLNTAFGVDGDYDIRPNIRLEATDYAIADTIRLEGLERSNRLISISPHRREVPADPEFWVGPFYQYVNRNSNQPNSNYDQNIIMLRLGAQL